MSVKALTGNEQRRLRKAAQWLRGREISNIRAAYEDCLVARLGDHECHLDTLSRLDMATLLNAAPAMLDEIMRLNAEIAAMQSR